MRIFISWSGERSKRTAFVLKAWLSQVLQASDPWVSEDDINKGGRSTTEIKQSLEDASFGVICVTRQNMAAPWLNYEAGALSRTSPVATFLLDMSPRDISGPMTDFQATQFDKADVRRLVAALNAFLPAPLTENKFARAFEKWWPDLETDLKQVLEQTGDDTAEEAKPSADTMLEEILAVVRNQRRDEARGSTSLKAAVQERTSGLAMLDRIEAWLASEELAPPVSSTITPTMVWHATFDADFTKDERHDLYRFLQSENVRRAEVKWPNSDGPQTIRFGSR